METTFKLGPLQEMWLKSLEEHPERQMSSQLGKGTPDDYKACCLGEALVCIQRFENKPLADLFNTRGEMFDGRPDVGSHTAFPEFSYGKMGLRNSNGEGQVYTNIEGKVFGFRSLASLNDNGVTWPQIAAAIRANPSNFFTESK